MQCFSPKLENKMRNVFNNHHFMGVLCFFDHIEFARGKNEVRRKSEVLVLAVISLVWLERTVFLSY